MDTLKALLDPPEESFLGEKTGVEKEDEQVEMESVKPWDPEKIRVTTKNFSLRNIIDMIDAEDLDLAPDFQRNQVWKRRQKSRLVESILLQIPLPAFYFAEDEDGTLRVVDGLQRLSTIHAYARGIDKHFVLRDLEYLEHEEGKRFNDLPLVLQRRILNAQIVVHVIDPSTPNEVKYDIFKRINTGGEPLNAMEIRHCMSKTRSRSFLKRCTESELFQNATGNTLRNHIRMQDREAVLRFCAFSMIDKIEDYENFGSMEKLLSWTSASLDDSSVISDDGLEILFNSFENAMSNAITVFGEKAFRKWPLDSNRAAPINRALFESWGHVLSRYELPEIEAVAEEIRTEARTLMTHEGPYLDSISYSTSDPRRVYTRFNQASVIVARLVK
ncbi:hypothetical protein IWX64_002318 [Arthrobacter sp. CAN_A212]|uniref:GmrSD restriction endonuclease domain-containing protein n=1 Tax=Arthrobacter sp. CAN_A212 TaxID=2787719 RepID=UPI0018C8ED70